MIYLGADHRGYESKEKLKSFLLESGFVVTDLGTNSSEAVDYPIIAANVVRNVRGDLNNRGVVLCGSGAGACIVANKFDGIRAAEAWTSEIARAARNDDNINVLCLAADALKYEEMKPIVKAFLDTSFGGEERYKRRLKQIEDIENSN